MGWRIGSLLRRKNQENHLNNDTLTKLKAAALAIKKFRQLHPDEQGWALPLLHPTIKTALTILDTIANTPLTYQEIANCCQLHPTSVRQILAALDEGGVAITLTEKSAFAPVGRPRKLARR